MPTTCAPSARRQLVASRCRLTSGSSLTSTTPSPPPPACSSVTSAPHAPAASAWAAKRPPSSRSPRRPTNRSPGPASRESTIARRGPPFAVAPPASRAPAAAATCSGDQPCTQRLPRHRRVVERDLVPAGELLALLVPLAGDDHDVAVGGQADRLRDRRLAVDLAAHVVALDAGEDLVEDRLGVLRARVVAGHDDLVGELRREAPHQGPLAPVAVAAGAEHHDHSSPRCQLARGAQDVLQRVGRVRVVDEHGEALALVD